MSASPLITARKNHCQASVRLQLGAGRRIFETAGYADQHREFDGLAKDQLVELHQVRGDPEEFASGTVAEELDQPAKGCLVDIVTFAILR